MTTTTLTPQATPGVHYRRTVGRDGKTYRHTTKTGTARTIRGNVAPPTAEDIITDDYGELVTRLPLTQGQYAVLRLADFVELQQTHGTVWYALFDRKAGRFYAQAATPRKGAGKRALVKAGRVLLGAGPGESVRYIDGDPCNLRRSNLRRDYRPSGGRAKREDRLTIPTPAVLIPRVTLEALQ